MKHRSVHILFIVALGLAVYSNTLQVPFQFDDVFDIARNPVLAGLSGLSLPPEAGMDAHMRTRVITMLSFALNYKTHGLDVAGYHVVNLSIHLVNALLFYLLFSMTLRAPFFSNSGREKSLPWAHHAPFFAALLFVVHPLQTQAVTYVIQRLASLATMFYLLTLVLYAHWRLYGIAFPERRRRILLRYGLVLVSAAASMFTKENAFTLPVAIVLYEFMFFHGEPKRRLLPLLPISLTMLIIPFILLSEGMGTKEALSFFSAIKREEYLLTQPRVIATYLRLLLFPINQNLDYDYPLSTSLSDPDVLIPLALLLSALAVGGYLLARSKTEKGLRLVSFGIFWFFITLSVESSIIPLESVIFEHRVYLPSAGLFMAMISLLALSFKSDTGRRVLFAMSIIIVSVFSVAAFARNQVWRSQVSLWEDVVKKSPGKARGFVNLGNAYYLKGLPDKAISHFKIALELKPDYAEVHNNLGNAYDAMRLTEKAAEHYGIALKFKPDFAEAHNNLGVFYKSRGRMDEAISHFRAALSIKPDYAEVFNNLGNIYYSREMISEAIGQYRKAVELMPNFAEAHYNLAVAYSEAGETGKAAEHLLIANGLSPTRFPYQ